MCSLARELWRLPGIRVSGQISTDQLGGWTEEGKEEQQLYLHFLSDKRWNQSEGLALVTSDLSSDRAVMFGGFKSNKRQRLQCVWAFRGSPLEISIKIFLGSQKYCQLPEELPTTRRQGLLPATAPLAAASNVIAQNAPRWRLLIAALIHNPLQCEVSIGPSDNGRHHKKQCHAPALLLPFITEQAVLKWDEGDDKFKRFSCQ